MTGFLLFLTAVPLAAILALLLNSLLDRRTAEERDWLDPASQSKTYRLRSLAALAAVASALLLVPAPASAQTDRADAASNCTNLDCSLEADREAVERLWSGAPDGLEVVVTQSTIPIRFDSLDESSDATSSITADDRARSVAAPKATETPSPR